jgi:hypothetical protein
MNAEALRVVVALVLFLHALAHLVALGALLAIVVGTRSPTGAVLRLWVLPRASVRSAALVGVVLWGAAAAGFLASAAAFWGLGLDPSAWRPLAVGASLISLLGLAVFAGTWPGSPSRQRSVLNTAIATLTDLTILAVLMVLRWPPVELFGR